MHEQSSVATVVQDHVGAFAFRTLCAEFKNAVGVIPVVIQCFAFVCEHRCAVSDQGSSSVVLGRENIARCPTHIRAQGLQRFHQHGRLNRHVQRTSDARALQRLCFGEFLANRHQTGHFGFGNLDFFAAPIGQGHISNVIVSCLCRFERCVHERLQK